MNTPARSLAGFALLGQRGRWMHGSLHDGLSADAATEVAIWLYRPPADRPELGGEFLRTARLLASVKHPLLPAISDSGFQDGDYFAVTEAIRGAPLTGSKSDVRADDRTLVRWARDLALALHAIHSQDLLVRDLKPANLRLDPSGRLRWIGAGLTQFLNEPAPEYVSPEELRGESAEVGPGSDVYSLGVTLYELLVGTPPFAGESDRVISQVRNRNREAEPVREAVRGVCPALEAIVGKALKKDRDLRYPDAASFAVDLQRLLNGDPVPLPMRIADAPSFDCPACRRPIASAKRNCLYCSADTTGLKPEEGTARPAPPVWLSDEGRTVPLPAVRAGLACHIARLVMYLLAVLVGIVGFFASVVLDPKITVVNGPPPILALTLLVLGVLIAVPPFVGLIGTSLCLATPSEARGRTPLIVSLALDSIALGLTAAPFAVDELFEGQSVAARSAVIAAAGLLQIGLGALSWAFLLGYCGRLAAYLGRRAAQFDAQLFIKRGVLLGGGFVLLPIAVGFLGAGIGIALGVATGDAPAGARTGANFGVAIGALGAFYCLVQILRLSFEVIALFGVLRSGTAAVGTDDDRSPKSAKLVTHRK